MKVLILLVCVCYRYADGGSAPFITPCKASDSACLKTSAQKAVPVLAAGLPDLGIKTMDPMKIDHVATSQAGLDMEFKDTTVKGLRNCVVESVKRKDKRTYLDMRCSIIMTGDYKLAGKLLILPIEGNGKYKIKIRDIVVKLSYDADDKMVNGEKYWLLHNWKHTADVKTGVEFNFQNLFNGNKQLADPVHEFANSNWKDIFQEVAPPIVDVIVTQIFTETKKLFDNVPVKELALP